MSILPERLTLRGLRITSITYAESEGIESDVPRLTKPFRTDELASALARSSS